jgi:alcohol dehydrogenase
MNLLNSFSFELPTKIEYGVGAAKTLADVINNLNSTNVLLITDKGVMRSGLLERITGPLEAHNLKWKVFNRVEANPKDYNVQEGTEIANRFGPDCLVALGGGSPIDCAKAIAVVARQGGAR